MEVYLKNPTPLPPHKQKCKQLKQEAKYIESPE